jgi:hypothetical protein
MKKLLITSAVLTVIATPAFAQSFCTCDGTGNVLKFTNNPITYQNHAPAIAAVDPSGLHAFATVPRRPIAHFNASDPVVAGSGSRGYLR